MENNGLHKGLAVFAAVAVVVVGFYTFTHSGSQGPAGPQGPQGLQGEQGIAGSDGSNGANGSDGFNGSNGKDGSNGQTFGSVVTPDNLAPNGFYSVNGVNYFAQTSSMVATSSNFCTVTNPLAGSSTVAVASFMVTANGLTASQTFDVSTSSALGKFTTSTPAIARATLTTGVRSFSVAVNSTTTPSAVSGGSLIGANPTTGMTDVKLATGESLTFKIASSSAGVFAGGYLTGKCHVVFQQL